MDEDLQQLRTQCELSCVLATYARMADERDWSALPEVFAQGATADYGGLHLPNREAILAMLQRALGGCGPTHHHLGPCVATMAGTAVNSRCSVRAAHRGAGELADQTYDCMGEYHDRWVHTAEGWRIAHRRMVVVLEFGTRRVLRPAQASR